MRKIIKIVLVCILSIFCLIVPSSCKKDDTNTIHIWMYQDELAGIIKRNIPKIENYCKENGIDIEVHCYLESEISYEDYILKRNLNLSKNNNIICGDFNEIKSLDVKHADYNKIENYKNIADVTKDLPYILVGYSYTTRLINKKLLEYYDINLDKEFILPTEFADLTFKLIDKGAKFNNNMAVNDLYIRKLMKKYNLYLDDFSTENSINDEYIENLKKATDEFLNSAKDRPEEGGGSNVPIVDQVSNLTLDVGNGSFDFTDRCYFTDGTETELLKSLKDTIVLFEPNNIRYGIYIGENVTNDKIYDVVNYMISKEFLKDNSSLFTCYTLKDDFDNGFYIDRNSGKLTDEYLQENRTELDRIKELIHNNVLSGNMNKELMDEIKYSTCFNNMLIKLFISNSLYYYMAKPDEEPCLYLDKNLDTFLSKLKMNM